MQHFDFERIQFKISSILAYFPPLCRENTFMKFQPNALMFVRMLCKNEKTRRRWGRRGHFFFSSDRKPRDDVTLRGSCHLFAILLKECTVCT